MSTRVTELTFRVETVTRETSGGAASSTTSTSRVSVAPTLLVLAKDDTTRIMDFVGQTLVRLDHAARTRQQAPLFATVHERVSGYLGLLQIQQELAAGSDAWGEVWQIQAMYGIRPA